MNKILPCIVLLMTFWGCKEEKKNTPAPSSTLPVQAPVSVKAPDTLPDNASFKVRLQRDSTILDETMFRFDHHSSGLYESSSDAVYFQGFGAGSLSSMTTDSVACAIQVLPFKPNHPERLNIAVKNNGIYILSLSYISKFPASLHLWLQDQCRKDSMDLRVGDYAFYVDKRDTSTFGNKRFRLIIR